MTSVPYNKRISLDILTIYEKVKIIGYRAEQLARGVKPLVDFDENAFDPIEIAKKELRKKILPFIVERKLPNNKYELWDIKELRQIN